MRFLNISNMQKGQFISRVQGTNMRLANLTFTGIIKGYDDVHGETQVECETSIDDGYSVINIKAQFDIEVAPRTPENNVIVEFDNNGVGKVYINTDSYAVQPAEVEEVQGEANDPNDEAFGTFGGFDY